MIINKRIIENFNPLPPLLAQTNAQPDRRQLSKRWLTGIIFISITSITFILSALLAALDGRTYLATPPELLNFYDLLGANPYQEDFKGDRLALTLPKQTFIDRQQLQFSTEEKLDDKILITTSPFEKLHMMLAQERDAVFHYPKFDTLAIFADSPNGTPAIAAINNAPSEKNDAKISFTLVDLKPKTINFSEKETINATEAEQYLHDNIYQLTDNLAHYTFIAPHQAKITDVNLSERPEIKVIQENLSVAAKNPYREDAQLYTEDILALEKHMTILESLEKNNYKTTDAKNLAKIIGQFFDEATIEDGMVLRLGTEQQGDESRLVRGSIYQGLNHLVTVAADDNDNFAKGSPPEMTSVLRQTLESGVPIRRISRHLPTIYDAIYRSVLSYNLPQDLARQLVRILATDIDLESQVSPDATLDILYPINDPKQDQDLPQKQNIIYVDAKFGTLNKKYYRFQAENGEIDYRDPEGHSAKQFLLRKPVPNGVFRSPFGIRRHPILGYVRMHTGVDWAAPRGSPIIAAGDGVITKIGASRGYGNHTEIQHANGYMTSYSHQSGFAPGIKKGTHIKQGQIIGYVGSTGLSTGPHCHFEIIVNGTKVDPMRVRIPQSKELNSEDLIAFKYKRNQIDSLLTSAGTQLTVTQPTNPAL